MHRNNTNAPDKLSCNVRAQVLWDDLGFAARGNPTLRWVWNSGSWGQGDPYGTLYDRRFKYRPCDQLLEKDHQDIAELTCALSDFLQGKSGNVNKLIHWLGGRLFKYKWISNIEHWISNIEREDSKWEMRIERKIEYRILINEFWVHSENSFLPLSR